MPSPPFIPKEEKPAWRILYDAFHSLDYNHQIPYSEIERLLPKHRNKRGAVYRCCQEMELQDNKSLICERTNGYRVMAPGEHLRAGQKRLIRGRRQVIKGRRTLGATELSMLKPEERATLALMQSRTASILSAMNKRKVEGEQVKTKEKVEVNLVEISMRMKRIEELLKKKKKVTA